MKSELWEKIKELRKLLPPDKFRIIMTYVELEKIPDIDKSEWWQRFLDD